MKASVAERIARSIDTSGGPEACWPWIKGRRTPRYGKPGYGSIYAYGQNRAAHAVALEEASGEKANGRMALHTCDNPPCCNPAHLYWGGAQQNMRDRAARNPQKHVQGARHPQAKLTDEQVAEIRRRYIPRHPQHGLAVLGREFGVHLSTIHLVVTGKHWNR